MNGTSPWPRIRLKYTCQVNPPAPKVGDEQEVSFVPMEAVGERGGISTDATRLAGSVKQGYTGFQDGDIVVAKITPCFENGKGSVVEGMLGGIGYGTTELHVLRSVDADRRWLFYVTQSRHFLGLGEGSMYGAGGQKRVPPDFVRNYEAITPPLSTQKAIAAFLDRKTAAIDALIEKKQKLLDLLAEKRAALINQAVTKGLDPDVPMKDSGIPWIGAIPAHWEVKRLKHVSPDVTVGIVITPAKYYVEEGVPALRSMNVRENRLVAEELVFISPDSNQLLHKSMLRVGDLVAVRTGQPGTTAVVDHAFDGANCIDLIIIRKSRAADSGFLCHYMNAEAARVQFGSGSTGAIQQHFNVATAKELVVCTPPLSEQADIASTLTGRLKEFDEATGRLGKSVERLQEYRQALITAAVTGQLDISAAEAA